MTTQVATEVSTSNSAPDTALQPDEHPQTHPVAEAIDRYLHSTRDIKFAARAFIPVASSVMKKQLEDLKTEFDDAQSMMSNADPGNRAHGRKRAFAAIRTFKRLNYSRLPQRLQDSLFVGLFSAFDVFTGELLAAVHLKKPALFDRLNRSIPLSTVMASTSIERLKSLVLDEEIEVFRRKSYPEQFEYLENAFGIVLRKFPRWPEFVEASQRRNLLTHCGGTVSEQYRATCQKEGYPIAKLATIGTTLGLGHEYFINICELMHEVALKLGQKLWRKVLPDDLKAADTHLNEVIYEALTLEQWQRAEISGEFYAHLPRFFNDVHKRMASINYAIALKHLNKIPEMKAVLLAHDWSASVPEFQLAEAILLDRTDRAVQLMKAIGREGQLLQEHAYYSWPLFSDFRESPDFESTYESIYGYPFSSKLESEIRHQGEALDKQAMPEIGDAKSYDTFTLVQPSADDKK